MSLVDEALQSSQSFVRALKSSIDPPHDNGPTKIKIARLAWESNTLYVPRKADLILEWILNRFHKEKSKNCDENLLLDHDHWSLLADILERPNDAQLEPVTMRASIPALLADFITLYPSVPLNSRSALLTLLHRSLDVLWPLVMQRSTSLDLLAECLWRSFAVIDQLNNDISDDGFVGLLTFVFTGFRSAFNNANTAGRKKIFNVITQHQLLPWLHSLYLVPPTHPLHSHVHAIGIEVLFSPDSLRAILETHPNSKVDREFYSTLFGTVTTSDPVARTSLLKLLPDLYRAYVVALRRHRSIIFPGANGAQNNRERIRLAAMRFEDECLAFPKRITDLESQEALCKATLAVLLVTEEEAIFDSTQQDDHTERLIRVGEDALKQLDRTWDESRYSESIHALDTLSCLQRIEPKLVLPLLPNIMERLAISSPKLLSPALTLLSLLTSYHAKTRTLHMLVTHSLSAITSSFPLLLPSSIPDVHPLLMQSSLLSLEFSDEVINALRSFVTPGQAKEVVKSIVEALQGCFSPHAHQTSRERPHKRRKLTAQEGTHMLYAGGSKGSASDVTKFVLVVQFGAIILGTILVNDTCMDASERRECLTSMDAWISDELQLAFLLDDGSNVVNGRGERQELGERAERLGTQTQQRFCAGILRLWHELFARNGMSWNYLETRNDLRSLASLHRLHDLLQNCMRENLIPELHLEIARVLYTSKAFFSAISPQFDMTTWPAFDGVLDFLESTFICDGDIPCPYSENHLTRLDSALALWGLTLERHLSTIDLHASQVQLDRLVNLMLRIYSEMTYIGEAATPSAGYILTRALDSASFWEYDNLRTSILSALDKRTLHVESIDLQKWLHAYVNGDLETFYSLPKLRPSLRDIVDEATIAVHLLHQFPPEYFPKNLKVDLIARTLGLDVLLTACRPDAVQSKATCRSFVVMITKQTQIKYLEDLVASRPDWIIYLTLFKCGPAQPTQLYTRATLALLSLIQNSAARAAIKTKGGLLLNIIAHFLKRNPYLNGNVIGEPIAHQSLLQFANMLVREFNASRLEQSVITLLRQLCASLEVALRPTINTAIDQTTAADFVTSECFINAWRVLLSLKGWLSMETSAKPLGEILLQRTTHIIGSGPSEAHLVSNEFCVAIINLLITEMQTSPETECHLVTSIIVAYVLFTARTDPPDTICDNSIANGSKSFSLSQYQRALELVAGALKDGPNGESKIISLTHLSALFLRVAPPGTSKISHEHASQCFRMFINRPSFVKCSSALAMQILDFIQYQCTERAASLRPLDAACILSFLSKLLAGCSEHDEHSSPSIFQSIVYVTNVLVRLRRDLLGRYLPHFSMILRQMFSAIRGVRPLLGHKQYRMVTDKLPKWVNPAESLGDAEARALARLLTSVTTKSSVRTHSGDEQTAASLARPFARHAPYVLLAYLQLLNEPLGVFSVDTRRELKPGLFALCTMMGEHGRDTLMVQSLDVSGKALLKSLWQEYEKQRYVGKG